MIKKILLLSCSMLCFFYFLSAAEESSINKKNPLSNFMTQAEMDVAVKNMKWWILPITKAFPDFSMDDFYFESQNTYVRPTVKKEEQKYVKTDELLVEFDRHTPSKKKYATANPGASIVKKDGKLYLHYAFDGNMGIVVTDKTKKTQERVLSSGINGSFQDLFWLDENRLVIGGTRIFYGKDGSTNIRQELHIYNCNTGIILTFVHDKSYNWDKWSKLPFAGNARYLTLARQGVDVSQTEEK